MFGSTNRGCEAQSLRHGCKIVNIACHLPDGLAFQPSEMPPPFQPHRRRATDIEIAPS
jgi:hypothetical protein